MPITVFSTVTAKLSHNFISILPVDIEPYSVLQRMCVSVGTNLELEPSTGDYIVSGDWFHLQHLHVILTKFISNFLLHRQTHSSFEPSFHEVTYLTSHDLNHDSMQDAYSVKDRNDDITRCAPDPASDSNSKSIQNHECRNSDEPCRTSSSSIHTIEKILSTTADITNTTHSICSSDSYSMDNLNSLLHVGESSKKEDIVDSFPKQSKKTRSCLPNIVYEDNNVPFKCKDCDFIGKNKNALCFHRHKVHLSKPTTCVLCDKSFPNERYMKRHLLSHDREPSTCNICGKRYKNPRSLVEHKKSHTENYVKPEYKCRQCSKIFQTTQGLESHCNSEHLGQKKRFLCPSCGKSFSTKYTLQQHANTHSGTKPFKCSECSKSFAYESALREHKLIHSNLKKFQCQKCSKRFNRRNSLQVHEKIHSDEKEFHCDQCGRSFTQKQALDRHERTHTGKKPYTCKICYKKFRVASVIRRHLISVHKIEKDVDIWREDIRVENINNDGNIPNPIDNSECENLNHLEHNITGDRFYGSMESASSLKSVNNQESNRSTSLMNDEQQNISSMTITMPSHDQSTACTQEIQNGSELPLYQPLHVSFSYSSALNVQGSYQSSIVSNESFPTFLSTTSIGAMEEPITCPQRICNEDEIVPSSNEMNSNQFPGQTLSIKSQANMSENIAISLENQGLTEQISVSQQNVNSMMPASQSQVGQQFHKDSDTCEKITGTDQSTDPHYHDQSSSVPNFQTQENLSIDSSEGRCTRMDDRVSDNLSTDQISVPQTNAMENQRCSSEQHSSLPRVENLLTKRIQQDEPPENLSISSLYAYYTNLASQFLSTHYPGYAQSHEDHSQ